MLPLLLFLLSFSLFSLLTLLISIYALDPFTSDVADLLFSLVFLNPPFRSISFPSLFPSTSLDVPMVLSFLLPPLGFYALSMEYLSSPPIAALLFLFFLFAFPSFLHIAGCSLFFPSIFFFDPSLLNSTATPQLNQPPFPECDFCFFGR